MVFNCYESRDVLKNLGAKWDTAARSWVLAFTIGNIRAIVNSIPNIHVPSDVTARVKEQEKREHEIAELKRLAKVDADTDLVVPGLNATLRPFQKLGVKFAVSSGGGALIADSPGLGKTIQAISAALMLKSQGKIDKCLVITPASLKFNWPIEIAKFTKEKFQVIDGTPEKRVAQWLNPEAFFFIANYELLQEDFHGGRARKSNEDASPETLVRAISKSQDLQRRTAALSGVRDREWGMVVVDEIHYIKGKSTRTTNVKALRGKYRLGLSGTPLDGRLEELHSVMDFIVPGLLGSRTRFLQRHAVTNFWGQITGYVHVDEVREKIGNFYIRRLKQDVLKELPAKVYQNIVVTLSAPERQLYKQIASRKHEITEDAQAMTAVLRCKQLLCHPSLIGMTASSCSKLSAFKDAIEEIVVQNQSKVVIFTQFKQMIPFLTGVLEDLKVKCMVIDGDTDKQVRAAMQEKFNKDETIMAMVGTDAMSTGLNFQSAEYVIHYDNSWQNSIMTQRNDRIHRIGKDGSSTIIEFTCHDTIEERIRNVLAGKESVSAEVLGDSADSTMSIGSLSPMDMLNML